MTFNIEQNITFEIKIVKSMVTGIHSALNTLVVQQEW